MSKEMTNIDEGHTALSAHGEDFNPFLVHTTEAGVQDGKFGRMNGNTGNYIIDGVDKDPGFDAAVDIQNGRMQWLGFDPENKPVRGPEVLLKDGVPLPAHPTDRADVKWTKQFVFPIVLMDGQKIVYSSKADYPSRPGWKMVQQYGQLFSRHRVQDKIYKIPVYTMDSSDFMITIEEDGRKIKAKKYKEAFTLIGWMDPADVRAMTADGVPDVEEDGADTGPGSTAEDISDRVEIIPPSHVVPGPVASGTARTGTATSMMQGSKFRR